MQSPNSPNSNPLTEPRTLVAIVLVILFMVGWQKYLAARYPQNPTAGGPRSAPVSDATTAAPPEQGTPAMGVGAQPAPTAIAAEQLTGFENEKIKFTVSNRGMGLKDFEIKGYKDAEGKPVKLGFAPVAGLFEIRKSASAQPLVFDVKETSPGHFTGDARDGNTTYHRELVYQADNGSFDSTVTVTNAGPEISRGLSFLVPETIQVAKNATWYMPSYNHQDFFVSHNGQTETINFNHAKENLRKDYPGVSLVSVGTQYFTAAVLDRSEITPDVALSADLSNYTAVADLSYKPVQTAGPLVFKQTFYAGPKSIDVLKKIDPAMAGIIDFGWLSFIARPLLYVMKWFYAQVPNWGLAIILLTLLVRFCVLPFNLMSVRSMRAMQKIQPLIADLRVRLKDDPMTMNKEMMALMKQNKANPLGGCLPMLIQIPVFFALYRVIGSSAELYQAPFAAWITDLSARDPLFVLPVLMGITMFLQQKLTPTAMDPAQAKMMQYLPLIFTAFMLQLPSGLTLYMVVSALFGITQQYLVMKDTKAVVPVVPQSGKGKR